jgi:hypothetical protein
VNGTYEMAWPFVTIMYDGKFTAIYNEKIRAKTSSFSLNIFVRVFWKIFLGTILLEFVLLIFFNLATMV